MIKIPQPTNRDDIRNALHDLLVTAHRNGVDPGDAGYSMKPDDPELPNWDVHITVVVQSDAK